MARAKLHFGMPHLRSAHIYIVYCSTEVPELSLERQFGIWNNTAMSRNCLDMLFSGLSLGFFFFGIWVSCFWRICSLSPCSHPCIWFNRDGWRQGPKQMGAQSKLHTVLEGFSEYFNPDCFNDLVYSRISTTVPRGHKDQAPGNFFETGENMPRACLAIEVFCFS